MTHAPTGAWQARCSTTQAGWLGIPRLAEHEGDAWITARAAELRDDWAERWQPEHAAMVGEMLRAALERRGDDLLVFQVWPVRAPIAATVRIGGLASAQLPDWRRVEGIVQLIDAPGIGPGVQLTRSHDEGEGVRSGTVDLVFDDGADAVMVRVEPTLRELLDMLAPGLAGVLASLEVDRPDGTRFRALPPAGVTAGEEAVDASIRERAGAQA